MKKRAFVSVITILLIMLLSGSFPYAAPVSKHLTEILQRPQMLSYYCGPAAAQSVLAWYPNYPATNYSIQNTLATELLTTSAGTGWYTIDGTSFSQYKMGVVLNDRKPAGTPTYYPYTFGSLSSRSPLTQDGVRYSILNTVGDNERAIAANGRSTPSGDAHLPGYPATNVDHWLVIKGYTAYASTSGQTVYIADPAKSPGIVYFSDDISATYYLPLSTIYSFAAYRGLIQNVVP